MKITGSVMKPICKKNLRPSFGIMTLLILIVLGCFGLTGCDSSTFEGEYITDLSFTDNGDEGVLTLDMFRARCGTHKMTEEATLESFTDVFANITITVDENSPGIRLNRYVVEYIPELSEDGTHTMVMPFALNNLEDAGTNAVYIPSGGSVTFTLTCFSFDQKEDYATLYGFQQNQFSFDSDDDAVDDSFGYTFSSTSNLVYARYTVRYILYFTDDNGQGKTIEVRRTAYFGPYDNCT